LVLSSKRVFARAGFAVRNAKASPFAGTAGVEAQTSYVHTPMVALAVSLFVNPVRAATRSAAVMRGE